MERMNLEVTSEFLIMASTLLYLKSKTLLPKDTIEEEELTEEQLLQRIIEYKKFKEISKFKDVIIYESCQICLGDFLDDDDISIFSCNKHILHSQCLNEWMLYEQICPICKAKNTKKKKNHFIFFEKIIIKINK